MIFQNILKYLDFISPLLLLVYMLGSKQATWRRDYLFWFILSQVVLNGTGNILEEEKIANLYIYHINCVVSFLVLSEYFRHLLVLKKVNLIVGVICAVFFICFIVDIMKLENFNSFNSYSYGLASFILTTYAFIYYLNQISHPTGAVITKSKDFWYVTGIFTYYASNFFIFLSYNWLTKEYTTNIFALIWRIHNVILLLMCVYIFLGFRCKSSK